MTGQTISHYRILDKLGEGGMGVVYKAEDTSLRRTVALKFLSLHLAGDDQARRRFLQEAQTAAGLSHPNICMIHEVNQEPPFLAMEFLEGQTLKEKIDERPLPLEEALEIATQAAQGLRAAHARGVTHRDIKPANLMVTTEGVVKLMDFGLARLSDSSRLTETGMVMGTPAYMSPEQARGETADARSDLWSLGVLLYEMVTGRRPFRGEGEAATVHAVLHTEPEPLTALRTGVPLELDRLTAKCLAKEPAERYQHADDLLVDLRAVGRRVAGGVTSEIGRR
ncbi:MAG: serine/threonine protein kinase, partial [Acidobacteriia bacterium]|nr:serine/threonine protein kinase [Terriglobia bacterium]